MSSVVPEARHGYFGDVPYIPPLEASLFFDDLRFCKTHRLPRSQMYHSTDCSFYTHSASAIARGKEHVLATTGAELLPIPPVAAEGLITSFPHDGAAAAATIAATPNGPTLSPLLLVNELCRRWAGVCTMPHRCPLAIEAALRGDRRSTKVDEHQPLLLHVTYPQRAVDFTAVIDAMLAVVASELSAREGARMSPDVESPPPPLCVFVLANVDLLFRVPELAAELSLFLWCFASIVHHHLHFTASRLRLVLTALDDEQGRNAVDACHVHLDRVANIATKQLGVIASEAAASPDLWHWSTLAAVDADDDEGTGASSHVQTTTIGGVVADVAKHVADVHQQICDDMMDGTTSVDASPVIVVWCGCTTTPDGERLTVDSAAAASASSSSSSSSHLVQLVEVALLGRYVAEPMRVATTMHALQAVPLPFDVAPLVVVVASEADLRECGRIVVERGMALHSVVCLALGGALPSAGTFIGASPATFQSSASLRSDLLWLEGAIVSTKTSAFTTSTTTMDVWVPRSDPAVFDGPRADAAAMVVPRHQAQRQSVDLQEQQQQHLDLVGDVSTFVLWLFRRFGQRPRAPISTAVPVAPPPDGTLSNRKQRRMQQHSKAEARRAAGDGITTKHTPGAPNGNAATPGGGSTGGGAIAEPQLSIRFPALLGARTFVPGVLGAVVKYLVASQCCETPPPTSSTTDGREGNDDNDDDGDGGGGQQQPQNELLLTLTPLGRLVTEGWQCSTLTSNGSTRGGGARPAATVFNAPLGAASIVAAKLLLAACTFRVPIREAVEMMRDGLANSTASSSGGVPTTNLSDAEAWCTQRGLRFTVDRPDVAPDMQHNLRRLVVLWSFLPHLDEAQRALGEPTRIHMNRVEALLVASKACRRAIAPAPARSTTCRGWFGSSTVSTTEISEHNDAHQRYQAAAASTTAAAADAVQSYRFPPVHELCEIGVVVGPEGLSFLCETAIELSELLVATKLLVSSMLHNNCVLAQAEPFAEVQASNDNERMQAWGNGAAGASSGRTIAIDFKLLRSVTLSSILSGVDVQQTLGGATASGLWLDGKLYDPEMSAPTRVEELRHFSQHATSLLGHCDHVAFAKTSSRKALKTEAAATSSSNPDSFDGVVPPIKDKRVIDEFITTAARVGRSRTEANLRGKRGFGFLTEGDVHHPYYAFYMNKATVMDPGTISKK